MPILIVLLLGTLIWFYIHSDPERMAAREKSAKIAEVTSIAPATLTESPGTEELAIAQATTPAPPVASPILAQPPKPIQTERPKKNLPSARVPTPETTSLSPDFTPWLSPLALNSYMRTKDQGHQVGFWDRGHWMTSIEGRWMGDSHEFRIRYAKTPDIPNWRWEYRINLTPEQFLETHAQMRENGFALVRSQSFLHPDQRRRYQAVWQSHPASPTRLTAARSSSASPTKPVTTEEAEVRQTSLQYPPVLADERRPQRLFGESAEAAPPRITNPERGALDVNRLQFQR